MGAVEKISVDVTEEMARDINAAVASGDYSDADEVVREALRAWSRRREAEIKRLKQLVEEGLASGEPRPLTRDVIDDVIRRGKARLAAERER